MALGFRPLPVESDPALWVLFRDAKVRLVQAFPRSSHVLPYTLWLDDGRRKVRGKGERAPRH
jgi:hypothetical protein